MRQQAAIIKVLCKADMLQQTANMLAWALGHRIEIPEAASNAKVRTLFILTDIEYYEDDETLLQHLGFDMIGKISGVVSWEVIQEDNQSRMTTGSLNESGGQTEQNGNLETELITVLSTLPVPISIMQRMGGKYVWKWLEATGQADTYIEAIEAAMTHVMNSYMLIRSEMMR